MAGDQDPKDVGARKTREVKVQTRWVMTRNQECANFILGNVREDTTQRRLKNAHSRATLKHFRDIAQLCLIILNVKNGKTKRYLLLGVCHFFFRSRHRNMYHLLNLRTTAASFHRISRTVPLNFSATAPHYILQTKIAPQSNVIPKLLAYNFYTKCTCQLSCLTSRAGHATTTTYVGVRDKCSPL